MHGRSNSPGSYGSTATKRTIALLSLLALGAQTPAGEIRSPNGRFVARVSPPSEVEIGETGSQKPPKKHSVQGLAVDPSFAWRLADDGATLVAIAETAKPKLPLVQVVRDGRLVLAADFEKLSLDPEPDSSWLLPGVPSVRMRTVEREGSAAFKLDLLARDGRVRTIDLETGDVRVSRPPPDTGPLRVETAASAGEPMFVGEWFAPDAVFAGHPVPVHVRGSLPTPAWQLEGFALRGGGDRPIVLVPLGTVRPGESISLQVLKGFEATALLHGLAPGQHSLAVEGRDKAEDSRSSPLRSLRVLPPWTRVFVGKSGGIAGLSESVALLEDGSVVRADARRGTRTFLADEKAESGIVKLLPSLPISPASKRIEGAADMFEFEIVRAVDGQPLRLVREDETLEPGLQALVEAMFALEVAEPEGTRFEIDLEKSRIEVRTGSSGVLSALGHDHRLMVRRFSGKVEREAAPEAWTLALEVESDSLAVVDDESQKDRAEIEKEMNAKVLEVKKFPAIRFHARRPGAGAREGEERTVDVDGELEIHGRKKQVRVPVKLTLHAGTLRATGKVRLKLSDFGVERTSAGGGTIKVADEIDVSFDVIASNTPERR